MKVIEQLVQHFHARGVLTPRQIDDLIRHGYVRRQDLFTPDPDEDDDEPVEPTPLYDPVDENLDLLGEEMSEVADRRGGGRKKGGKDKAKPTGHDLAPLEAVLTAHLASRSRYPAMAELGRRLTAGTQGCPGVHDQESAATAVADADPADLEAHLVTLLNHRPPALGELWYWCDTTALFDWAEHEDHADPVADALAALLTAGTPSQVGRVDQLKKLPQVDGLLDVLRARKALLGSLRGLYDRHFGRLKVWLVNPDPGGLAGAVWPALPWAFVLLYNIDRDSPVPGYAVRMSALPIGLRSLCWETAWRMGGLGLLRLVQVAAAVLRHTVPARPAEDGWQVLQNFPHQCPYEWTV